jgi:hypothetical protein
VVAVTVVPVTCDVVPVSVVAELTVRPDAVPVRPVPAPTKAPVVVISPLTDVVPYVTTSP